jgi:hypothetical protein
MRTPVSRPKVSNRNPRHLIVVEIGSGNKYCSICPMQDNPTTSNNQAYCLLIGKYLKNGMYGPARCEECLAAEKRLEDIRQSCRKEGETAAYYRANQNDPKSRK